MRTLHLFFVGQTQQHHHASKHADNHSFFHNPTVHLTSANCWCAHHTRFLLAGRISISMHPSTQTRTALFTIRPCMLQVQTIGAHTTPVFCWPDASAVVCIQARRRAQLCSQPDRACYKCKLLVRTPHLFFVGQTQLQQLVHTRRHQCISYTGDVVQSLGYQPGRPGGLSGCSGFGS